MMGKTQYGAKAALDWMLGGADPTRPSDRFISLFTVNPTDTTAGTEVSTGVWTNYARIEATFAAASNGSNGKGASDNAAEIDFGTATVTQNLPLTGYALHDHLTAGNMWLWGEMGQAEKVFAAEADDDLFTSTSHGYADGTPVFISLASATLPGGFSAGTVYYVRDSTTHTFKLAATAGGVAIGVSSDGVGVLRGCHIVQSGNSVKIPTGDLDITED